MVDHVQSGQLSGPAGSFWAAGTGLTQRSAEARMEARATGDVPAVVLELAVIPQAAATPSSPPAASPSPVGQVG